MRVLNWKPSPKDERDFKFALNFSLLSEEELPSSVDLTSFVSEVWDQKSLGSCHDAETEVLTEQGWKLFKNCTLNDKLASVEKNTGNLIFEHPSRLIEMDFNGELVCANHRNVDFKVTPDHRMLVRKWNETGRTLNKDFEFVTAENLGWYFGLPCKVNYKGKNIKQFFTLKGIDSPKVKAYRTETLVPMNLFLQFLGIYLAEGTMLKNHNNGFGFQIAAVKDREKEYVRNLLTSLNLHFLERKDRFVFYNKQWYKAFEDFGLNGVKSYEKFVPEFVFDCSGEQIKNLLLGHFMGDGCETQGNISHYTSSELLAENLQRLIFLSGGWGYKTSREPRSSVMKDGRIINGIHPEHRVSKWRNSTLSIDKKANVFTEYYNGKVYCAEVPTYQTLVTRRNNKILISGNCVGHGTGMAVLYQSRKQNREINPSRLFIYYNARAIQGWQKEDSGCYIRDAFKSLNKQGVCKESTWPYIEKEVFTTPNEKCYDEAIETVATKYHKLNNTLLELKNCLAQGRPFVFGFAVFSSFMNGNWTDTMPYPRSVEQNLGGHCVIAVGYDDTRKAFRIKNSWGKDWKDGGYFWMPYSYIITNRCDDFWTIEQIKEPVIPEPIPEPVQPIPNGCLDPFKLFTSLSELKKFSKEFLLRVVELMQLKPLSTSKTSLISLLQKELKLK